MLKHLKKLISFGSLLISATAFPLVMLFARVMLPKELSNLVIFQSTSVFIVFIIQMGLRAGGRMHFHMGHRRMVEKCMAYLNYDCLKFILLLSAILPFIDERIYFSFCAAQAILSFNQGIFIAQTKPHRASATSFLLFLNIIISSLCVLLIKNTFVARILVEVSSLAIIYLQARIFKIARASSFKCTLIIIKKYFGLQVGSFIVYFSNYLFAQLIVSLEKMNHEVILAYADANIVCGSILLLVGQALVVSEGKVIESSKQNKIALLYSSSVILFSILFSGLSLLIFKHPFFYSLVLSLFILGRFAFAFCSQFASERGRKFIYLLGFISASLLLINLNFIKEINMALVLIFLSSNLISTFLFLTLNRIKHQQLFLTRPV